MVLGGIVVAAWGYFSGQWDSPEKLSDAEADKRNEKVRRRDTHYQQGEDLKRYPRRLRALEDKLQGSYEAAVEQLGHLTAKAEEMESKGREDLAERYRNDLEVLENRASATQRVMATVWKTRAILHLRVHLAIAARQRPDLDHLPAPLDVQAKDLEFAAMAYANARDAVRRFVETLDQESGDIPACVPAKPQQAEISPEDELAVQEEVASVEKTLRGLRERMDKLGDTLDYLSDRFRTQRVVEGSNLAVDVGPEAGKLLSEVSGALKQLDELSAVGDKGLADAAVDGLDEDISRLEEAGLEAAAEAEAQAEVQRLLEQFAR